MAGRQEFAGGIPDRNPFFTGREQVLTQLQGALAERGCPIEFADALGAAAKARRVLKLECNHWTPIERGIEIAEALEKHWTSIDG
jgi:hypothetical protein